MIDATSATTPAAAGRNALCDMDRGANKPGQFCNDISQFDTSIVRLGAVNDSMATLRLAHDIGSSW